jgi:hypothetical protein
MNIPMRVHFEPDENADCTRITIYNKESGQVYVDETIPEVLSEEKCHLMALNLMTTLQDRLNS